MEVAAGCGGMDIPGTYWGMEVATEYGEAPGAMEEAGGCETGMPGV